MGHPRPRPERLAEKLRQIRTVLGLSQSEMLRRIDLEETVGLKRISDYELGIREPTLTTILQYARAVNVYVDVLIDDELDLPERLPTPAKSDGVRRKPSSRSKPRR